MYIDNKFGNVNYNYSKKINLNDNNYYMKVMKEINMKKMIIKLMKK